MKPKSAQCVSLAKSIFTIFTLLTFSNSPTIPAQARENSPTSSQFHETDTVITVNTLEDELNADGDCSLREAITAANTNVSVDGCPTGQDSTQDTITFSIGGTITLSGPLTRIISAGPLVIDGEGIITVSGNNKGRVFNMAGGSIVTLKNLTVSSGLATCCNAIGSPLNGGGLENSGDLTIINSTFISNTAEGSGGGIVNEAGTLIIVDSLFSGNKSNYGGAVYGRRGITTVVGSTFTNNSNRDLSGGYGGAIASASTLNVTDSTFYSNTTYSQGGALWVTLHSNATVTNSTFYSNSATGLYGTGGGSASDNDSIVTIINSTFSRNYAELAGGTLSKGTGTISLRNTILDSAQGDNCVGLITDGGHNIDSGTSCNFNLANGSMSATDPLLGPLADNGGATHTIALLKDSPAINHADPAYCPPADQRGLSRRNGYCDIGALESQPALIEAIEGSGQYTDINLPFALPLMAKVLDTYDNNLGGVDITFTGPESGAGISNSNVQVTSGSDGVSSMLPIANNIQGGPYIVTAHSDSLSVEYCLANLTYPITVTTYTSISTPGSSFEGQPVTVTYIVTSTQSIPIGEVTVTVSGGPESCEGSLSQGTGSCTLTLTEVSTYTLMATYSGDPFHLESSDTVLHIVEPIVELFDIYLPTLFDS